MALILSRALDIHLEQSLDDRLHGHFPFDRLHHADAVAAYRRGDPLGRFIFVDIAFLKIENINVVLAEIEEFLDIVLQDDVPFFKGPTGEFTRDDAGDVVKKHKPDCFLDRYFSHHGCKYLSRIIHVIPIPNQGAIFVGSSSAPLAYVLYAFVASILAALISSLIWNRNMYSSAGNKITRKATGVFGINAGFGKSAEAEDKVSALIIYFFIN